MDVGTLTHQDIKSSRSSFKKGSKMLRSCFISNRGKYVVSGSRTVSPLTDVKRFGKMEYNTYEEGEFVRKWKAVTHKLNQMHILGRWNTDKDIVSQVLN